MPFFRKVAIALLLVITLVSCRRDPAVAKKRYLESGNTFLEKGRYKEAMIQYQNAIKIDRRYGPAHYKLASLYLKMNPPAISAAYTEFKRAAELLENNQAYQKEYRDSIVQVAGMDISYDYKRPVAMEEAWNYCDKLLKKDPNSFDGFRLLGDYNSRRAAIDIAPSDIDKDLAAAMENYRKAEAINPNDNSVAMAIAALLELKKQYPEAEAYFRKVIDRDKTDEKPYRLLYQLYMQQKKTVEAEQLLIEGSKNNPKVPDYMIGLAAYYGSLGRRDDMLNVLQQIKSRKDIDSVYQVVGDFYGRMGDLDSALREFREGIEKDPKHKLVYQKASVEALVRQGKRAEAAALVEQIHNDNPKDPDVNSSRAEFMLDRGDVAKALTELQSVVTSNPENAVAHFQLGRAYLASGRQDAQELARQQFKQAIEHRPDMIQPRLGLAELQVAHGEFDAALDTVQDVLNRDPMNQNAHLIQSRALLGQKKFGESDNVLGAMLKANPSSPQVLYQAGVSALAQGKTKEAAADFMRSYELNPANAMGLLGVVDADVQMGKPDEAMAVLMAESKKAPNRLDILFLMGRTAKRVGKYQDALDNFNKVLNGLDKKADARANIYMEIGDTYRVKGDRENAVNNYLKAREIKPDNPVVLQALGLVLDTAGRRSEARQVYEASLKIKPNDSFVLNNLAYLMADTGADLDIALNYAQKAKSLDPNQPQISDTVGWILLKKGLPDMAMKSFQELTSRYPDVSTYHFHLAMAYKQKSDVNHAVVELREAQRHSPPSEEQQKIQEMLTALGGH